MNDALSFTEDFIAIVNAEHLITTNIAQKIRILGPKNGGQNIKIQLEISTKEFSSKCIPLIKTISPKSHTLANRKSIFRKPQNTSRNGRIDIAVLENNCPEETPICAIEVKGFDPSKNLIIKDLQRNLEYFKISGATGESRILFTEFCAIHTFPKTILESSVQSNHNVIDKKYKDILSTIKIPNFIKYEIHVFDASKFLFKGCEPQEDYDFDSHNIHHHVGVIIIFKQKTSDSC